MVGLSHAWVGKTWGESIPGRGNSHVKIPGQKPAWANLMRTRRAQHGWSGAGWRGPGGEVRGGQEPGRVRL